MTQSVQRSGEMVMLCVNCGRLCRTLFPFVWCGSVSQFTHRFPTKLIWHYLINPLLRRFTSRVAEV